jgi:prolyl-tRNA synthetase
MMGGQIAHEFMYISPVGEDTIIICDNCGYSANRQIARGRKDPYQEEKELPLEKVSTPNSKTIEELASYLSIPTYKTAKAVFTIATFPEAKEKFDRFVFTIVRGDMELNETKLINTLNAIELRPATEAEIRAVGAVPGYASPVGLKEVLVVVDELIPNSTNLVSGANIEGYHLRNVNYGRDYKAEIIADITTVRDGDGCIECGHALRSVRGVEVGNIFKLGTRYSKAMGCNYLDRDGQTHPIIMGSYGIGSGRLLACIAEEHHDEHGLIWPITVSPYQVHLVTLSGKVKENGIETGELTNNLYHTLTEEHFEVLFDDRDESPGIKFNDADLIGVPIRLTISDRSIKNGGVEYKRRDRQEKNIISTDNIIPVLRDEILGMEIK